MQLCNKRCDRFPRVKMIGTAKWCRICSVRVHVGLIYCPCCATKLKIKFYKRKRKSNGYPELTSNRLSPQWIYAKWAQSVKTNSKIVDALNGSLGLTTREIANRSGLSASVVYAKARKFFGVFGMVGTPIGNKREYLVWVR